MRIHQAKAYLREGIVPEFGNARIEWTERIGYMFAVLDHEERIGAGEATPLPGYSPESVFEARRVLDDWAESAEGCEFFDLDDVATIVAHLPARYPSARFAVETALLDLLAQSEGRSIAEVLAGGDFGPGSPTVESSTAESSTADSPRPASLPLAALVPSDEPPESAVKVARRLLALGMAALKVKIGRPGRFADELRVLDALRSTLGDGWELRLDANGTLPPESVDEQLRELAAFEPAFIEEPVSGDALLALRDPAVPIALDETLRSVKWSTLAPRLADLRCRAVVLKPTVLGGALVCLERAREAVDAGLDVVVSHTFEGAIALQASAHLAWALALRGVPVAAHGLAQHPALLAWPEATGLLVGESTIAPPFQAGLAIDDPDQLE